jgi:type I restriction enzyme S subunit
MSNLLKTKPLNNWKIVSLGEVIELIGGGTPKTTVPEYWNGEIPWLSVVDFNNDVRWVSKTEKTITHLGLEKSSTKLLNKGDIIISARGTVGALAQLSKPMAFNQSCYGIRNKEGASDINFLYYLLKYSVGRILKNTHGAVFDTITRETFNTIEILLPPLPEQREIAAALSCLDDKIELLREQNGILEEMAQRLFREWFVEFNFPDEEGRPYRASGGKMVDTELGDIPEGWRGMELRDMLTFVKGKKPAITTAEKNEGNIPQILIEVLDGGKKMYTPPKGMVVCEEEDLVMVMDGASSGRIEFGFSGAIGSTLSLLDCKKPLKSILYFFLKNLEADIKGHTTGSAIPHTDKERVYKYQIVLPESEHVLVTMNKLLSTIRTRIVYNRKLCLSLSEMRKSLLPSMMSGEARVKKIVSNQKYEHNTF